MRASADTHIASAAIAMVSETCSIAFRVDANSTIGVGHLRRCTTLATELRKHGCDVRFVCKERLEPALAILLPPCTLGWLEDAARGLALTGVSGEELWDAEATLMLVGPPATSNAWIVVDHYRLACPWERRIREAGYRVAAIDDYRDRMHCADLLISDSEVPFDPAFNELSATARVLHGRRFAIVDGDYEFANGFSGSPAKAKRVLVSYGGSDPTGETVKVLDAIRALKKDDRVQQLIGKVDLIVGPLNRDAASIKQESEEIPDVDVHHGVPVLAPLMRQADLILTAGGNTMVEALALRKPCIVTITGDNQALAVEDLCANGIVRSLGHHAAVGHRQIEMMLADALLDYDAFAGGVMSQAPFDHLGSARIATEILNFSPSRAALRA